MRQRLNQSFFLLLLAGSLSPTLAMAQGGTWANFQSNAFSSLADDYFAAAAGVRDPSKQVEAPSIASNGTTLLDTTKASDLVSAALNLSQLTGTGEDNDGEDGTAFSGTATAWAIYSAIEGIDPLSPVNYCSKEARWARRFSMTLGREEGSDGTGDAVLFGTKIQLGEDTCNARPQLNGLSAQLSAAANSAGIIAQAVLQEIQTEYPGLNRATLFARLDDANDPLRKRAEEIFGEIVERDVKKAGGVSFARLGQGLHQALAELEKQQSYGLIFNSKQRDGDRDEYSLKLAFERGLGLRGLRGLINGGYEHRQVESAGDAHGAKLAVGLTWTGKESDLEGRRPLTVSLSGDAEWLAEAGDTYRGQVKLVLPILEGIELPISVTVANQTDLIQETDVRGLVGFTLDTSQLASAFRR